MSTARIVKDHPLSKSESLVLLAVTTDGETKEYITIVKHDDGLSFRCAEQVTAVDKDLVWMRRTMFNGRSADELINGKRSATLNSRNIVLEKSRSPSA